MRSMWRCFHLSPIFAPSRLLSMRSIEDFIWRPRCSPEKSGAFTGDISGSMLKKLDCTYVLVGHSERRAIHDENDELVNRKMRAVLDNEMIPIFCIGEELPIRESGSHVAHVLNQVKAGLKGFHKPELKKSSLHMNQFGQSVRAKLLLPRMPKRFVVQ